MITTDETIILGQDPTRYKEIWLALHNKLRERQDDALLSIDENCYIDPLEKLERKLYDSLTEVMTIDVTHAKSIKTDD